MQAVFGTGRRLAGWLACTVALLLIVGTAAAQPRPAAPAPAPPAAHPAPAAAAAAAAAPAPAPAAPAPAAAAPAAPAAGDTDEPVAPTGPGSERAQPLPATPPATAEIPPSEAEKARGLQILDIDVAGNRRVAKDDVLTYLHERVGQAFSPDTLSEDVRELWNSGFFEDIEVDLSRTDEGVTLRFLVRERPNVGEVEFEGNNEIDNDDLSGGIEVKANTVLSYPAVRRSVQKIRDMYAEKGYFLAEVKSEIVPQKNNEVAVKFKITEHGQVSVRRITFIGNDNVSDQELKEVMFTGNAGFFAFGSGGPFRQDAFERDIAMISALYYDRGFLSVQIATPRVMLTPDKNGIEITITIDEGPRYKIRQLRVYERGPNGEEVEPIDGRRNLRNMVRAKSGDYFNRAELLEDLGSVKTLYHDHGYANVEANPETHLDPDTAEVDIVVPIERGPIVHFERIEIRGNSKTRDKVIRREMEIAEGDQYSETLLEKSRRRITALGYFERVDISTEEGSQPDRMNVYVEVTERPTGTFQVGAGFSSIENFIATAQVQQANLFGNGQSLSLQAQVSGLRRLVDLRFFEPYFLDSEFSMSFDLYDQLRIYNDFSQTSQGGAITFGYPLISPELVASRDVHRRARQGVDADHLDLPRHVERRQRVHAVAAREPVQRRAHVQRAAGADLRHARQPAVSYQRHLPSRLDGARQHAVRLAERVPAASLHRPLLLSRWAAASWPS